MNYKELVKVIDGAEGVPSFFTRYQVSAIEKVIARASVSFSPDRISEAQDVKGEIFIKGGYPYIKIDYTDKSGRGQRRSWSDMISVCNGKIKLGYLDLRNVTRDNDRDRTKLVEASYDESKNVTVLRYETDHYTDVVPHVSYKGTITLMLPGDVLHPQVEPVQVDGKGFVEFMKTHLPKKVEWHRSFDWDEIEYCSAKAVSADKAEIDIVLPTGKGYGDSHRHRDVYEFRWDSACYGCINHKLYDRDREAQIVRKFVDGFEEYIGFKKCPQYLDVIVEQELD